MKNVYNNILETIGHTPIVRLNSVVPKSPHTFWAKLELFNPGGSAKDRIAFSMIEGAEKRGQLKAGATIFEGTSGNTGLGLAMVAAVKGYKCVLVMPEKIAEEKRAILRAYGAQVVITPNVSDPADPRGYLETAKRLAAETPNSLHANQFWNEDNPEMHYRTTGPEVWEQMGEELDVLVAGAATGGTISGTARYLKEKKPDLKVVLADPVGSILHDLVLHGKVVDPPKPYKVEGVGDDMLPGNLHLKLIGDSVRIDDRSIFQMTRQLAAKEGICVGPSSAMALVAAIEYSKKLTKPSNILAIFPDGGRGYLSKAFSDQWMKENGLL